jgi:hypothetical protein
LSVGSCVWDFPRGQSGARREHPPFPNGGRDTQPQQKRGQVTVFVILSAGVTVCVLVRETCGLSPPMELEILMRPDSLNERLASQGFARDTCQ